MFKHNSERWENADIFAVFEQVNTISSCWLQKQQSQHVDQQISLMMMEKKGTQQKREAKKESLWHFWGSLIKLILGYYYWE